MRQLVNPAGAVLLAQTFDPFGNVLQQAGIAQSPFGFTGEQTDPTGLVYLRAQYYQPHTGRFLTHDPFPGLPTMPATLHPYTYALNNPILHTDPSYVRNHTKTDPC